MSPNERPSPPAREALAWIAVLAAGWVALAALSYRTRDADSRLYAEIVAQTASSPAARWIAPDFPSGWYMSGPFREHPVGLFLPAALLARLGYPAAQAAYALNALYQVLSIVLLQRLAATVVAGREARTLGWLVQLLPIAFTYRIRANHEQAVLLCLLVALLGVERSRRRLRWAVLTGVGLVGLLLLKGALAALGPPLCALWLLARRSTAAPPRGSDRSAWLGLALAVVAMGLTALGYERLYRAATGEPFWSFYLGRQLGAAAVTQSAAAVAQKLYNLVWYLGRVLWFAFPWSLVLLVEARRLPAVTGAAAPDRAARAAALFVAGATALYLGAFCLSDRRADRYIFPVYYAVGAGGAVAALRSSARFRRLAERLERPWLPAAVWALAFLLHVAGGRLGMPTVKLWAPDS